MLAYLPDASNTKTTSRGIREGQNIGPSVLLLDSAFVVENETVGVIVEAGGVLYNELLNEDGSSVAVDETPCSVLSLAKLDDTLLSDMLCVVLGVASLVGKGDVDLGLLSLVTTSFDSEDGTTVDSTSTSAMGSSP